MKHKSLCAPFWNSTVYSSNFGSFPRRLPSKIEKNVQCTLGSAGRSIQIGKNGGIGKERNKTVVLQMRRSWNGKHEQCPLCTGHIFQSLRQGQDMVFWLSHLLKRCSATPLAAYLVACAVFITTSSDAVSLRP